MRVQFSFHIIQLLCKHPIVESLFCFALCCYFLKTQYEEKSGVSIQIDNRDSFARINQFTIIYSKYKMKTDESGTKISFNFTLNSNEIS